MNAGRGNGAEEIRWEEKKEGAKKKGRNEEENEG